MKRNRTNCWLNGLLASVALCCIAASTGCQISVAGQTLPSGFYFEDDIQYFRKGPEFKLAREAAALKAAEADAATQSR
jgi:hypothetical protein